MALKPYDELSVRRAQMLKAYRAAIRLKHSLRADAEIAATLPAIEEQINEALMTGEQLELEPADAFRETL